MSGPSPGAVRETQAPVTSVAPARRRPGQAPTMEQVISRTLQAGLALSASIIGLGVVVWAVTGDGGYAAGESPVGLGEAWAGALVLRPLALVQLGLLALVVTPVVRVAVSVVLWWRRRDWAYVAITGTVLALLALSFWLGASAA